MYLYVYECSTGIVDEESYIRDKITAKVSIGLLLKASFPLQF